jgi:hypothetical protein
MKIKQVIYGMLILTGILIEKYGLKGADPELVKYFGWGIISLGSFNIVLDYIRKPKNKRNEEKNIS